MNKNSNAIERNVSVLANVSKSPYAADDKEDDVSEFSSSAVGIENTKTLFSRPTSIIDVCEFAQSEDKKSNKNIKKSVNALENDPCATDDKENDVSEFFSSAVGIENTKTLFSRPTSIIDVCEFAQSEDKKSNKNIKKSVNALKKDPCAADDKEDDVSEFSSSAVGIENTKTLFSRPTSIIDVCEFAQSEDKKSNKNVKQSANALENDPCAADDKEDDVSEFSSNAVGIENTKLCSVGLLALLMYANLRKVKIKKVTKI